MSTTEAALFLGKTFSAKVDRPLGSKHPVEGFIYPVNYGFVPDTKGTDAEEVDAYILGIFEPLTEFAGRCIAVICRVDDNDDELVLVPEGRDYNDDQIRALTEFQERFFTSVI